MSNVHFVDTSVLVELLNIPQKSKNHQAIKAEYEELTKNKDIFILPVAVLIETGNHIAHISDGNVRRNIAIKFAEFLKKAVNHENNLNVMPELSENVLKKVIDCFPSQAQAEVGFGDTSIIEQFKDYWSNHQPIGHMRIWSLDDHLSAYEMTGGLSRRRNK